MAKDKYDAGNPSHVKTAKRERYVAEAKFDRGLQKICNDPDILNVFNKFFEEAGSFRDEPQITTPDFVYEHGRNQGKKSLGLWWLNHLLLHDADIIGKLQQDEDSAIVVDLDEEPTERE